MPSNEKISSRDLRRSSSEKKFFSLSGNLSKDFQRCLFSAFAGNLALPIYALFVPLLASRLGASLFEIGIVGGASNAVYSFLPVITGHFSDRRGSRRFFIVSSFLVLTVVSVSFALISSPVYLIVARIFEGVGWAMLWPAMDAAVGRDVAGSMDANKAFSLYNVSWSAAAAIGPLLGSTLIFLTSIRDAFLVTVFIMGVTFVVNAIPSLRHHEEKESSRPQFNDDGVAVSRIVTQTTNFSPVGSKFYGAACAVAAVSSGVLFTFFAPYARSLGISILLVGVITFAFGFGRFLFYILTTNERVRQATLRSDKRVRNMMVALAMASVSGLLVSLRDPSGLTYLIAYGIGGVGISIVYTVAQTGMISESAAGRFGRSAGLFETSIGIGACAGPIIGGAISGTSLAIPFLVPSLGFALFLAAFAILARKGRVALATR